MCGVCEKTIGDGLGLQKVHKVLVVLLLTGLDARCTGLIGCYTVEYIAKLVNGIYTVRETSKGVEKTGDLVVT